MEAERDDLRVSVEKLNKEKGKLEDKVIELEVQRTTMKGKAKMHETQIVALEDQKNSLEVSLKTTMEQKADVEPLKKHSLTLKNKSHQIQLQMVEERFKVQQIEIRLEEIINTSSYFLDRTRDILETLQGRMTWVETNKEPPVDVPPKDLETIKQEYELIEFAIKVAEELVKTVRKTKSACAEFYRRILLTYNRCQISASRILEVLSEHELFLKQLQEQCNKDEHAI